MEVRDLLNEDTNGYFYLSGQSKPITSLQMADVDCIIRGVLLYCTVYKVKADLDQLIEGLKLHNVIKMIRQSHAIMRPLFVYSTSFNVNIQKFNNLCKVNYSTVGSSRYQREEDAMRHLLEFVDDLGNGAIGELLANFI